MRTLITGANGFLGSHLARALTARGDEVQCLVREGSDTQRLEKHATLVRGDVTQTSSFSRALKGVDVCFHLAGVRRASTRDEFMRVNVEGTRQVCEAMVAQGARRLVFCGSLAASGPSTKERPRLESDPFSPEEWYGESKAQAEQVAFSYSSRLEVTAIRPSRIAGPLDVENLPFFKLAKRGLVLVIGTTPRPLTLVDVDDVVQQLLLQADRREAVGEAFFSSSSEVLSVEALMRLIAGELGVATRDVRVPEWLLRALAHTADVVSNVTGQKLPLNRKLARQLLAPGWTCSIQKAQRLLGYTPRVTLAESVKRSVLSYREAGWL